MPVVTLFIDECRAAFGVNTVNQQIRRGMHGEKTFFAAENGHTVGIEFDTPDPDKVFSGDKLLIRTNEELSKGGRRGRGA